MKKTSEDQSDKKFLLAMEGLKTIKGVAPYMAICVSAFALRGIFHDLAGQNTSASLIVGLLANLQTDIKVSYGVGLAGAVYGVVQHYRIRFVIRRYSRLQKKWELTFDAGRTSSLLTKSGDTREEDE